MQYYGAFYRSALNPLLSRINSYLMRWLRSKYKRPRPTKKATACWQRVTSQPPALRPLGMGAQSAYPRVPDVSRRA
jgi:RNA-directed DNA polymerase